MNTHANFGIYHAKDSSDRLIKKFGLDFENTREILMFFESDIIYHKEDGYEFTDYNFRSPADLIKHCKNKIKSPVYINKDKLENLLENKCEHWLILLVKPNDFENSYFKKT